MIPYEFSMKMRLFSPPCSPPLVRGDGGYPGGKISGQIHSDSVLKINNLKTLNLKIYNQLLEDCEREGILPKVTIICFYSSNNWEKNSKYTQDSQ